MYWHLAFRTFPPDQSGPLVSLTGHAGIQT
jgi:hypothetical protein